MNTRLLISLPNWLGDAVLSTGLLSGLQRLRGSLTVDVCGNSTALAVTSGHPVVRRSIRYERHGEHQYPGPFFGLARSLRAERYSAHLVLPPSLSAAIFARAVGASRRAGFSGFGRGVLLTHCAPRQRRGSEHLLEEYRRVLDLLELGAEPQEPEVSVSPEAAAGAKELLDAAGLGGRSYAVLAPGATYGATKRWPFERFLAVGLDLARSDGLASVLVGGAREVGGWSTPGEARDHEPTGKRPAGDSLIDLTGETDIPVLVAVLAGATVVVANDSGPLHLARAVGVKAVGVFGSTEPGWTGPRGGMAVVAAERPPCAPCFRRTCPIGVVCLTRISAAEVIAAVQAQLADARAKSPAARDAMRP